MLTRIDSVELISISELSALARAFPAFEAYVSKEPSSDHCRGVDIGMWLMPKGKTKTTKAK